MDSGIHTVPALVSWQIFASTKDYLDTFYLGFCKVLKEKEENQIIPPESFIVPQHQWKWFDERKHEGDEKVSKE